jgi:hypothetical protein
VLALTEEAGLESADEVAGAESQSLLESGSLSATGTLAHATHARLDQYAAESAELLNQLHERHETEASESGLQNFGAAMEELAGNVKKK